MTRCVPRGPAVRVIVAASAGAALACAPAAHADYAKCKWNIEMAISNIDIARAEVTGSGGSGSTALRDGRAAEAYLTDAVTHCANQPAMVTTNVANALTKTTSAIVRLSPSPNSPPARGGFRKELYGAQNVLHQALTALPKPKTRRLLLLKL